jgi:hypothetical protein
MEQLTERQTNVLRAVAEKVGVPLKLTWSLRARRSLYPNATSFGAKPT